MSGLNRRDFIGRTLAGAGALPLLSRLAAAQAPETPAGRRRASDRVPLGKTGLKVSRFGMGTGTVGWEHESNQTRLGPDAFTGLVRHAYERGINFFDAADMYGSHAYYRKAFEKLPREEIVVATKINWRTAKTPSAAIDRFRLELGLDVLDVVLVHCATHAEWPKGGDEGKGRERRTLDAITAAKAKGIVRAVGVSCHGIEALRTAAETPGIDYHFVRINPAGVKMDAPPDQVAPVLKSLREAGRATVGMKIVGEGALKDRIDESLRYALALGTLDSMIVGFEKPDEIDDFTARMERILNG